MITLHATVHDEFSPEIYDLIETYWGLGYRELRILVMPNGYPPRLQRYSTRLTEWRNCIDTNGLLPRSDRVSRGRALMATGVIEVIR